MQCYLKSHLKACIVFFLKNKNKFILISHAICTVVQLRRGFYLLCFIILRTKLQNLILYDASQLHKKRSHDTILFLEDKKNKI